MHGLTHNLPLLGLAVLVFLLAAQLLLTWHTDQVIGLIACIDLTVVIAHPQRDRFVPYLFVALLVLAGVRRPAIFRIPRAVALPLTLFFVLLAVRTYQHDDPKAWNFYLVMLVTLCSGVFFGCGMNAAELRAVKRFLIWAGVLLSCYAVFEAYTGAAPLYGQPVDQNGNAVTYESQIISGAIRAQATLGHPLVLAFLLTFALILVVRELGPGSRRNVAFLIIMAGIVATGSRSAIAVTCVLILVGAWRRFSLGRTVVVLGVVVAGLYVTGFFGSGVVTKLMSGGSYVHRMGSVQAVPDLLSRQSGANAFFGNGFDSALRIAADGLLPSISTFHAVDDQFVTTLIEGGVFAVVLLVLTIFAAFRRGDLTARLLMVATVVMFFSFDVFYWASCTTLFALAVGMASRRGGVSFRVDLSRRPAVVSGVRSLR